MVGLADRNVGRMGTMLGLSEQDTPQELRAKATNSAETSNLLNLLQVSNQAGVECIS